MAAPTQDSFLWTTSSSGDGSASGYTQSDWSKILKIVGSCHGNEGVGEYLNEYAATDESATVIVDTGGALVDGKPHECTVAGSVACIAAVGGGNTRIDRIALRADWGSGASPATVRIVNIPGTDAGTPTAPSLTTTSETTYEIALWQALVDTSGDITLTDERNYADITTACAIAASMVTADKLATNTILTSHITNSNVTTAKIANDAVTTAKILAANVTLAKMAVNSIDSDQYVDGSIDTAHLANDAVTQAKMGTDTLERVIYPLLGSALEPTVVSYGTAGGMYVSLDKSDFPAGATVKLCAYIGTLSGTMYVRLMDGTSSASIVGSELSSAAIAFERSGDLLAALPSGSMLYIAQVKETSGATGGIYGIYLEVDWS